MKEGFFSAKETSSDSRPDGKVYSCVSCGRYKGCYTPKMKASGEFNKGILNIGSFPTQIEDRRGKHFQNKEGILLEKTYKKLGIDLHKDCLNIYAVNCMGTDIPSTYELDCCRKSILKIIETHKPKIIILLGEEALYSVIGNRWKSDLGKVEKWRGFTIPDQDFKAWVCPTFAIKTIIEAKYEVSSLIWEQDLKKAFDLINTPFRYSEPPVIEYLTEDNLKVLNAIKDCDIAFDYETTGLKPYAKGHKIVCASVAYTENNVYSFMMPTTKNGMRPFTDLLLRQSVAKIAANMKFEDTWSIIKLRTKVVKWLWDTMQAAHIIDNRSGVTGLKFQTYVNFGIVDYASEISPYLKAKDDKDANSINRIEDLLAIPGGKHKLLQYGAYDSIYEYRLSVLQRKIINTIQPKGSRFGANVVEAYELFHNGILDLAKAERQGLRVDENYTIEQKQKLTENIENVENELYNSKFYKHWRHVARCTINLDSPVMLGSYLYGTLGLTPKKYTKTGKGSTDEQALSMLHIPELDMLLKRSKLMNLRDTFLEGVSREQVNGRLHPFFNLHLARTYRSSSNNPNFQNIPKRDTLAMTTIRSAIYPRVGHQLLEMDFSGIEVCIAACYHQDPNMVKYIKDPNSDMHGDMARQIFIIDKWDRGRRDHSLLRGAAKNGFVFPQFYGDYYKNNAENICNNWVNLPLSKWDVSMGIKLDNGITIAEHLISKKINSYDKFAEHLKGIEADFWNNRFPRYAEWKEEHFATYLKYGYIPLKTGFVCSGVMGKNDVSNYPVQGSAFHCLLWTFSKITEELEKRDMQSKVIGQIHDAVVFDIHPPELNAVYYLMQQIVVHLLPKHYTWINVPLGIDAELCPIDGNWAEKKKWKPEVDDLPF